MSRTLRLIVLGAAAGLIASFAMEHSQKALRKAAEGAGAPPVEGESSTVKAADKVAVNLTGHPVDPEKRERAGRLVHYTTGAGLGAAYTLIADRLPFVTAGFGGLYGLLVSLGLDEWLVPKAGLSAPADAIPAERHAEGIAAHLAFGSALEAARRVLVIAA